MHFSKMDKRVALRKAEKLLTAFSGIGLVFEIADLRSTRGSFKSWNGLKIGFFSTVLACLVAKYLRQRSLVTTL